MHGTLFAVGISLRLLAAVFVLLAFQTFTPGEVAGMSLRPSNLALSWPSQATARHVWPRMCRLYTTIADRPNTTGYHPATAR
jgi:hypothetical protein